MIEGMETVLVELDQLTNRQLHLHLVSLIAPITSTLEHVEQFMADLETSVADLQAAVDAVAVRFNDVVAPLTQALADAQTALADLQVTDDADKAALQAALDAAQAAGTSIEEQVDELNQVGATAEPPPEA